MLIKLCKTTDGHLAPMAWSTIAALPDEVCFHHTHEKRHPKSIYGNSIRVICKQWVRAFVELDKINTEHYWGGGEKSHDQLLREYRELLYRLNEHHDACLSVLRTLSPTDTAKPVTFDSEFLKKKKFPGAKSFMDSTAGYRNNHIGHLVNTMKHGQGELVFMYFSSATEFLPGFYLQDILPHGVLGPSAKLHSGGRTAFSFARDMMMHLWWLYRTGELLSITIKGAMDNFYGMNITSNAEPFNDSDLLSVIRSCADLKLKFFPDEVKQLYPRILLQKDNEKLSIEFPTKFLGRFPENMRIITNIKIDGAHPTNKMPYFGTEYENWERSV